MGPPVHPEADTLILFGASGDLARKKLLPALYELTRAGRLEMPVIGVADTDWFNHDFAERARESVVEYVDESEHESLDTEALDRLCDRMVFISGDYGDDSTWRQLASATEDTKLAVAFLAVPPSLVGPVVKGLDTIYLAPRARVVVEKPFGRDLVSAKELNHTLHDYLDESQLYRIDHFLGKEPVQNLMVFRFANSLLESVWNRNHVESVTVTMAESFGVEGRGRFYDGVGCIRDVVQNHLLQMVALLTMEPPASKNQHALLDEKVKVFRAMRPWTRPTWSGVRSRGTAARTASTPTPTPRPSRP